MNEREPSERQAFSLTRTSSEILIWPLRNWSKAMYSVISLVRLAGSTFASGSFAASSCPLS